MVTFEKLLEIKKYYIFGAHSRGQTAAVYMKTLCPEAVFLGFLINNEETNREIIDDKIVIDIRKDAYLDVNAYVFIATRSVYHEQIVYALSKLGMVDIIPVDVVLDNLLRNAFVSRYFEEHGRSFYKIDEAILQAKDSDYLYDSMIYVVKSEADSVLGKETDLKRYEAYIQAGRAVAGNELGECVFFDNDGENISAKNKQMCELTALYWIWKNSDKNLVGIEHYRRRFVLPENWEMLFDRADVILTTPLYVFPSVRDNYCMRHIEKIWDDMMNVLADRYGEKCFDEAKTFFESMGCYSPCNMLIAKKQIFDNMCEWLFPVLFDVMEKNGVVKDRYQNRYPGFLSERLISFYFYFHRDKYEVIYADKVFLK